MEQQDHYRNQANQMLRMQSFSPKLRSPRNGRQIVFSKLDEYLNKKSGETVRILVKAEMELSKEKNGFAKQKKIFSKHFTKTIKNISAAGISKAE